MSTDQSVFPVRIRTARKPQRCDSYPPCPGIEPGERYEDHRLPPGNIDIGNRHWIRHKIHYPRLPENGPDGCTLAAAYREHQRREQAAA